MNNLRSIYADLAVGRDDDFGTLRWQYTAPLLVLGDLEDLIAYGRSIGLGIQDHRGGGWLVKRGWIVAKGERARLRRLLRAWITLVD